MELGESPQDQGIVIVMLTKLQRTWYFRDLLHLVSWYGYDFTLIKARRC